MLKLGRLDGRKNPIEGRRSDLSGFSKKLAIFLNSEANPTGPGLFGRSDATGLLDSGQYLGGF